jgi:hypothetical protein
MAEDSNPGVDFRSVWIARPETRWALWAGIAGALAAAAVATKGILASASSTAAIGFIFVPLVAAAVAIPVGIWGAALGHVVLRLRGAVEGPRALFIAALVAAAALPAVVGYEVSRGFALERAVHQALGMDPAGLEQSFDESPWRRNKYFLAILADHENASGGLLARIAGLEDGELYEPLGTLWDVMGRNRKGLAVMRLVALNPNTPRETLERLAQDPDTVLAKSAKLSLERRK